MLVGADVSNGGRSGTVSGGAGTACGGGWAMRIETDGSGLPNSVRVDGSPFEADRQLPHKPAGRVDSGMVAGTTGDVAGQSAGGTLPRSANSTPEPSATSRVQGQVGAQADSTATPQQPPGRQPQQQQPQPKQAGQPPQPIQPSTLLSQKASPSSPPLPGPTTTSTASSRQATPAVTDSVGRGEQMGPQASGSRGSSTSGNTAGGCTAE